LSSLASCSVFQQAPGDAKITADVHKRLREHTPTEEPNVIYVSTQNRVVYLTGDVDTRTAKDDAELIARETPGVKDVVNTIVGHVP